MAHKSAKNIDIPTENTRPQSSVQPKTYDRKSASFYLELAEVYEREAHSLEIDDEHFAGKASMARALRTQAEYNRKMGAHQLAVGVKRAWSR